MEEEWRKINIKGIYDYEVSNKGRIRALEKSGVLKTALQKYTLRKYYEKMFNPSTDSKGYPFVYLCGPNKFRYQMRVHRLVAEAFLENPENKCCVNHINGIRNDNRLENLEWVTHSENIQYAYDNGRMNKTARKTKLTQRQVDSIREEYPKGGQSHRDLSRKYGIAHSQITAILNNKSWKK